MQFTLDNQPCAELLRSVLKLYIRKGLETRKQALFLPRTRWDLPKTFLASAVRPVLHYNDWTAADSKQSSVCNVEKSGLQLCLVAAI